MAPSTKDKPVIAFTGGRILTMDPEQAQVGAVVIRDGRILEVGDADIIERYPGAAIIDLGGRTLLPGFIDAHNHLSSFGCFFPLWADLIGLTDRDAILNALRLHAGRQVGSGCVVGFGWFDAQLGGVDLTRRDLDDSGIDRPVILIHATFHKSVANTAALERIGITRSTPDPECGTIVRDANGKPTGVLIEHAQAPVFRYVMAADTRRHADLIRARAQDLPALGITAVHDPGVTPAAEAAYRMLHAEKGLPISVLMMPHGETLLDNRVGDRLFGPVTGSGDEWLRTGQVKLFADGATAETTALSLKIGDQTISSGTYRDDFSKVLLDATARGFRVCVHSFGNATTDAVLNAFENAAGVAPEGFDMRPRLEHVTLLDETQIRRLAAMGGCVCIQSQFIPRAKRASQMPLNGQKWYAYRDLVKGGVTVAAGSDDPGGFMDARDPVKGSVMGASMSDGHGNVLFPDQVLPFETWLWMYTAGSAYSGGQENERGMLKKGLVADLVVLDATEPPVVAETWIAGKRVYVRETER